MRPRPLLLGFARAAAGALALYHRARLRGAEHIPDGACLLVGNHGLFGLETFAFFWLLERATGRLPRGLADRRVFGAPGVKDLIHGVGSAIGTPANALAMLADGALVVCYPGGAREVFKRRGARYRLAWDSACGFARVAIAARAPVVPFAAIGVDDAFLHLGHVPMAHRVLGRYAFPLALGPLPARFRFVLAPPIAPPADERAAPALKARVQETVQRLLAGR